MRHWYNLDSNCLYKDPVDEKDLEINKRIKENIKFATLTKLDGSKVRLESIASSDQRYLSSLCWVYKGTNTICEEAQTTSPTKIQIDKRGNKSGEISMNGQLYPVEYITENARKSRNGKAWVYKDTGNIYSEKFDLNSLINTTKDAAGNIISGTLVIGTLSIELELISHSIQERKKRNNIGPPVQSHTFVVLKNTIGLSEEEEKFTDQFFNDKAFTS